ncbi:integrase core domain protein [Plakobranchus ocellatus]|uniref:Integrase core domain protein n=1 Tax=Plakobranchus ocellatus TaxID=259542 RepID=A0AAV3Y7J4_9GAST|nr:integrase core domain protein [Plakobranchus ocellatus]
MSEGSAMPRLESRHAEMRRIYDDLSQFQVDLIDFQYHPDEEYKFLMVYHDYLIKFVVLTAPKTMKAEEVACKQADIFTCLVLQRFYSSITAGNLQTTL